MWTSKRAVSLHVALALFLPGCVALTWWQAARALGGNSLSWVYTFEWPIFGVYGHGAGPKKERTDWGTVADWRRAMGIDWMTGNELSQAIPPAYTELIGKALMGALEVAA